MSVRSAYDDVAADYDEWVRAGSALADPTFTELTGEVDGQEVCVVACCQGCCCDRCRSLRETP